MSAIAYITDSRMLQMHRLNNHKTMNFWRISTNVNFSDFDKGDLVFFLSKDKEHKNKNEKGIVGFGRLDTIAVGSIKTMWDKYGILNGYRTIEEFKEAIRKVTKDRKLPRKISSFYLVNVTFFQPVYLSECGMKISDKVESYIYLKPEEVTLNLLELSKSSTDLWTNTTSNIESIQHEERLLSLFTCHKKIKDVLVNKTTYNKAFKTLKQFKEENTEYDFVQNSKNELYKLRGNYLEMIFYCDKSIDEKLLVGQANLYRYYFKDMDIVFKTCPQNRELENKLMGYDVYKSI